MQRLNLGRLVNLIHARLQLAELLLLVAEFPALEGMGIAAGVGHAHGFLEHADRVQHDVDLAAQLQLKLVAASNNHGFGRAAAAWNLIGIPGWQNLAPEQLATLIEERIRQRSPGIVMRTRPRTHDASLPFTLPVIAYQTLGSLTFPERISWLVWIWGLSFLLSFRGGTTGTDLKHR